MRKRRRSRNIKKCTTLFTVWSSTTIIIITSTSKSIPAKSQKSIPAKSLANARAATPNGYHRPSV